IDLTTGTSTNMLTASGVPNPISILAVDAVNDIISTVGNHGFIDGQLVVYNSTGAATTTVGGLTSGQTYRVLVLTSSAIKLVAVPVYTLLFNDFNASGAPLTE